MWALGQTGMEKITINRKTEDAIRRRCRVCNEARTMGKPVTLKMRRGEV